MIIGITISSQIDHLQSLSSLATARQTAESSIVTALLS